MNKTDKAVTDPRTVAGMRDEIQNAIRALYHARNLTNQPHFYAKLTMAIQASEACLVA